MGRKLRVVFTIGLLLSSFLFADRANAALTDPERQAVELVRTKLNTKRENKGLNRLFVWKKAAGQAQNHSSNMSSSGDFNHKGFCDGVNVTTGACGTQDADHTDTRADRIMYATGTSGIGFPCENIYVQGSSQALSPETVAKGAVSWWSNSTGHHNCMYDVTSPHIWVGVGVKTSHVAPKTVTCRNSSGAVVACPSSMTWWYVTLIPVPDSSGLQP
jgi:uncharacterized protein YkwD